MAWNSQSPWSFQRAWPHGQRSGRSKENLPRCFPGPEQPGGVGHACQEQSHHPGWVFGCWNSTKPSAGSRASLPVRTPLGAPKSGSPTTLPCVFLLLPFLPFLLLTQCPQLQSPFCRAAEPRPTPPSHPLTVPWAPQPHAAAPQELTQSRCPGAEGVMSSECRIQLGPEGRVPIPRKYHPGRRPWVPTASRAGRPDCTHGGQLQEPL